MVLNAKIVGLVDKGIVCEKNDDRLLVDKTIIDSGVYSTVLSTPFHCAVKKVVCPIISNQIPLEYVEDVYQDVFFSVWKNITSYITNMEHKTECQRLAWLITVAKGRIADCYKKIKKLIRN